MVLLLILIVEEPDYGYDEYGDDYGIEDDYDDFE